VWECARWYVWFHWVERSVLLVCVTCSKAYHNVEAIEYWSVEVQEILLLVNVLWVSMLQLVRVVISSSQLVSLSRSRIVFHLHWHRSITVNCEFVAGIWVTVNYSVIFSTYKWFLWGITTQSNVLRHENIGKCVVILKIKRSCIWFGWTTGECNQVDPFTNNLINSK